MSSEPTPSRVNTDEPVLIASDISRSYGDVSVLEEVSLELYPGTLNAVVGPNGSGKTTLLQTLAGILEPTGGSTTYQGPDAEREIGYLPQRPAFRPHFTTAETLEFYTAIVDDDPEELLTRVGLRDAGDRRVEALSGGMTRLLGLAQATVGNPPVVILDEPGSGLDPTMRKRTFEVARELADDGTTVLLSSHDLALVEKWTDTVFVLDSGKLVETGSPEALCDRHDVADLWEVFDVAVDESTDQVSVLGVDV